MTCPPVSERVRVSQGHRDKAHFAMQVAAHQVFEAQGPQPYSLVVLGSFAGSLASSYNPAGSGVTTDDCSLLVPQITGGPQGVTGNQCVLLTVLRMRPKYSMESAYNGACLLDDPEVFLTQICSRSSHLCTASLRLCTSSD